MILSHFRAVSLHSVSICAFSDSCVCHLNSEIVLTGMKERVSHKSFWQALPLMSSPTLHKVSSGFLIKWCRELNLMQLQMWTLCHIYFWCWLEKMHRLQQKISMYSCGFLWMWWTQLVTCRGAGGRSVNAASRAEGSAALSQTPSVPRWPQRLTAGSEKGTLPAFFIFMLGKGKIHTASSRTLQVMSETHFSTEQPIYFRTATVFLSDTHGAGEATASQAIPCSCSPPVMHQKLFSLSVRLQNIL